MDDLNDTLNSDPLLERVIQQVGMPDAAELRAVEAWIDEVGPAASSQQVDLDRLAAGRLVELVPVILFETNERGDLVYVNQHAIDATGFTRADLEAGLNCLDMLVPEERERAAQNIGRVMRGEQLGGTDYTMRRKDGTRLPVSIHSRRVMADGHVTGLRGIIFDVSARKAVETALRDSERRFRSIFDQARDGIAVLEAVSAKITLANSALCGLLDVDRSRILGRGLGALIAEPHRAALEDWLRDDDAHTLTVQLLREDASTLHVELSRTRFESARVEQILVIIRDVSERERLQKQIDGARRECEEAFDALPNPILLLGSDLSIVRGNLAALALFPQLRGAIAPRCATLCGGCAPLRTCTAQLALERREAITVEYDASVFGVPMEATATVRHAADGEVIGVVLALRDISDRQRAERETLRAQKLESLGVLAAGLAHDFNNLLAAIQGNVSAAREEPGHAASAALADAERATLMARQLTAQLLAFAKGARPQKAPLALAERLDDWARFALSGSSVTHRLDHEDDPEELIVEADEGQLQQVFYNLLTNAREAMPHGGVIRLETDIEPDDETPGGPGRVVVRVKDEGVGIDAQLQDRVFDPYFTTKGDGSGLGLAVAHGILARHGGSITLASEVGRGSTFTVRLPRSARKPLPAASPTPEVPLRGCRVLLMDDSPLVRSSGTRLLELLGCEVVTAADGAEAIEHFVAAAREAVGFDVVIVDMTVPRGLDGQHTLERLRALDAEVPIVLSSGYSDSSAMLEPEAAGFTATLPKPYTMRDLRAVLCKVTAARHPA